MVTIPTVDQSRLVTYKPAEKQPMSEQSLKTLEKFTGRLALLSLLMFVVCVITIMIQAVAMLTWPYWNSPFVPLIPWHVIFIVTVSSFVAMAVAFVVERSTLFSLELHYWYVPQGMIVEKDSVGGGDYPLRWTVTLKGFNRSGDIRSYESVVKAGDWHDQYKVGDYIDLRDDDDKEHSLTEPLS